MVESRIARQRWHRMRGRPEGFVELVRLAGFAAAAAVCLLSTSATAEPLELAAGQAVRAVDGLSPGAVNSSTVSLDAGDVLTLITTPLAVSFGTPDTLVGLFDAGDVLIVANDDAGDDAPASGLGSALRFVAGATGTFRVTVTGTGDASFDGSHSESGAYALIASVETLGATASLDSDPTTNVRAGADGLAIAPAQVIVADLAGTGDVDWFALRVPKAGDVTIISTPLDALEPLAVPDTLVGVTDAGGTLLVSNDDAGDDDPDAGLGSAVRIFVAAPTTLYIAVTGFSDAEFDGSHTETGRYALTVSTNVRVIQPVPSLGVMARFVLMAALTAALGAGVLRKQPGAAGCA